MIAIDEFAKVMDLFQAVGATSCEFALRREVDRSCQSGAPAKFHRLHFLLTELESLELNSVSTHIINVHQCQLP